MLLTPIRPAARWIAAALVFGFAGQANADDYSASDVPKIAGQACAGINPDSTIDLPGDLPYKGEKWRVVPTERVAHFIVSYGREAMGPQQALERLGGNNPNPGKPDRVNDTLLQFQDKLASGNLDGMLAFGSDDKALSSGQVDPNKPWLKDTGNILRCLVPEKDDSAPKSLSWRLRGNVDALPAEGKARLKADAASFGFTRTRTFQDDGSRTQNTEISVNAVLGATLGHGPGLNLTGFVGYQLKKNRAKPTPILTPPATERDGDTDLLTLGLMTDSIVGLGGSDNSFGSSVRIALTGGYLFDFVKDSERIKAQITLNFYHRPKARVEDDRDEPSRKPLLGVCDIGGLTDLGGGIWTQCGLQGVLTYNQVTKHGSLLPAPDDHFGHVGGKVSATLYLGDPGEKSSFFASAEYLNLRRYDGSSSAIPHVQRHSISVGHRWWQGKAFALEIKGQLTDGINPDSFVDENALTLGFGVIF
jgi:hypothetical protein